MKDNFTSKYNDSEPALYQTKNTAREIKQEDQENTSFKQVKTTMLNANHRDTCVFVNGIETMSQGIVLK